MKSLQESLFDRDIMNKSVPVEADVVWDLISKNIEPTLEKLPKQNGWKLDVYTLGLKIYKIFHITKDPKIDVFVEVGFEKGNNFYPCIPSIFIKYDKSGMWVRAYSNNDFTKRELKRKFGNSINIVTLDWSDHEFECNTGNIDTVLGIMKSTFDFVVSKEFNNIVQGEIDKFAENEKTIPGVVVDNQLMKPLIKQLKK